MSLTNFAALTDEAKTTWSRDLWKAARNNMFISRFTGTGQDAMIQRITELTKSEKGSRAVITLVADLEGDGVAGDRQLEGNEESMKAYDQVIQLDQLRHASRHEGRMADQKSVVNYRKNARDVLSYWVADRCDQLSFLTMSGVSYGMTTNGILRPANSDLNVLEFASDVTAPSSNRHLRWDSTSGGSLKPGATNSVISADKPTWNMLIEAKAYMKDNYIRPMRGSAGMEVYNVFMTPQGIAKLKQDPDFIAAWRNAMPRSGSNPLFKGTEVIYVDGLAIYEYRHVYNTKGATSGSKWGAGGDVDGQRVLFCGAQAMGMADIGSPEWIEKGFDYDNQQSISVGKIFGMKKPVFRSQVTKTDEDFGILCVDTAL